MGYSNPNINKTIELLKKYTAIKKSVESFECIIYKNFNMFESKEEINQTRVHDLEKKFNDTFEYSEILKKQCKEYITNRCIVEIIETSLEILKELVDEESFIIVKSSIIENKKEYDLEDILLESNFPLSDRGIRRKKKEALEILSEYLFGKDDMGSFFTSAAEGMMSMIAGQRQKSLLTA